MTQHTPALLRLSDTDHVIADPTDDIRGRTVRDSDGKDLGKVDDLLVDSSEEKVRFLRVESGGILGLGATPVFIPVEAVTEVAEEIRIDQSAAKVADAPRYDPDIREGTYTDDAEYYGRIYGHYGYVPFWAPGYLASGRPIPRGLW